MNKLAQNSSKFSCSHKVNTTILVLTSFLQDIDVLYATSISLIKNFNVLYTTSIFCVKASPALYSGEDATMQDFNIWY